MMRDWPKVVIAPHLPVANSRYTVAGPTGAPKHSIMVSGKQVK